MDTLRGSVRALILFDVAEQIHLDLVRDQIRAAPARREPSFKHPTPGYVRFERPPVVEYPDPAQLPSGERCETRIRYFDYGVASVEMELPFELDWDGLVRLSSHWMASAEIESCAAGLLRSHLRRVSSALVQPYETWLSEDYYIIHLKEIPGSGGKPAPAAAVLASHGPQIVQIVRGETTPLSEAECHEVLQHSMSYYPCDLLVAGWNGAFLYDTPEGAAPTIQLLEFANSQLLEFRHYDDVLTKVLADVYTMLERRGGFFGRWKMARRAEVLNAMRLDITELTERSDNAIKFLSDMFYARAYRMAANRVGVDDYRRLVEEKLRTAGELYQSMVNEFHQARAFVLEAMVVAILVIELIHLFAGRG